MPAFGTKKTFAGSAQGKAKKRDRIERKWERKETKKKKGEAEEQQQQKNEGEGKEIHNIEREGKETKIYLAYDAFYDRDAPLYFSEFSSILELKTSPKNRFLEAKTKLLETG